VVSDIGLGYFGGELIYGTKAPAAAVSEGPAAEGAMVFNRLLVQCSNIVDWLWICKIKISSSIEISKSKRIPQNHPSGCILFF
jgi:hypothetical protein